MKTKRSIALALCTMIVFLSACSSTKGNTTVPGKTSTNTAAATDQKGPYPMDPLTLSIYLHSNNTLLDGNMPVYKKAADITGISLKQVVPSTQTDRNVSFSTMISARPLPDIIGKNVLTINEYALQGAMAPLDELIDKHAPNIKEFYKKNPDRRKELLAADGKQYIITNTQAQLVKEAWFVRQDWLDKLKLKQPSNVKELYDVLKAFATQDPNGNGQKDEVPFFSRLSPTSAVYALLCLQGVRFTDAKPLYIENDEIKFSFLSPKFKDAMKELAKWYKEGIIDNELYTRKDARTVLLANNQGGATYDFVGSTVDANDKLKDKISGFNFKLITHPADTTGKRWDYKGAPLGYELGWGISVDNKHPVETIKYFDFWFTKEGRLMQTLGLEGESYVVENGKYKATDKYLKNSQRPYNLLLCDIGAQETIGGFIDIEFWEQFWAPDVFKATQQLVKDVEYVKPLPFFPIESKKLSKANSIINAVNTYCNETMQKWIMGVEGVDASYDKFVQEIKKMGIDEYLAIQNEAYKKYLGK